MHVPADRIRIIQELYSESFTFCIDNRLPQTVLGQCIVSYRKFIDYMIHEFSLDVFESDIPVTMHTSLMANYRDKTSFGITVQCTSVIDAIRVTKLALKRSTGDCFSSTIKIKSKYCIHPITNYIAESKKIATKQNCQVLPFR